MLALFKMVVYARVHSIAYVYPVGSRYYLWLLHFTCEQVDASNARRTGSEYEVGRAC